MRRREARELSNEEFDERIAAHRRYEATAEAADEEGGPRLSLVPVTDREEAWPTDLLPAAPALTPNPTPIAAHASTSAAAGPTYTAPSATGAAPAIATPVDDDARVDATTSAGNVSPAVVPSTANDALAARADATAPAETAPFDSNAYTDPGPSVGGPAPGAAAPFDGNASAAPADAAPTAPATPIVATPFDGIPLEDSRNRLAGWSGDRQRLFLTTLAETGSVHLAASTARRSARSAYKLRMRSPAFAAAWDTAEQLAVGRLSALAFDRAIHGRVEQVWQEGDLVLERRVPSDRMLTWLLERLDPRRYAAGTGPRGEAGADPQAAARTGFAGQLDALADLPA